MVAGLFEGYFCLVVAVVLKRPQQALARQPYCVRIASSAKAVPVQRRLRVFPLGRYVVPSLEAMPDERKLLTICATGDHRLVKIVSPNKKPIGQLRHKMDETDRVRHMARRHSLRLGRTDAHNVPNTARSCLSGNPLGRDEICS